MSKLEQKYDLIIACIGSGELDENVISKAYTIARNNGAEWKVLNILDNNSTKPTDPLLQRLIRKASVFKAEIIRHHSPSVKEGIVQYAESLNSDNKKVLFVIGTPNELRIPFLNRNILHKTRRKLNKLGIDVESVHQRKPRNKNYAFISPIFNFNGVIGMFETLIYVCSATLIGLIVQKIISSAFQINFTNVFSIYLIFCVVSAVRGGIISGFMASVLSAICINFFFYNQGTHFQVNSDLNLARLTVFFVSACILSAIGSATRVYILESRQKEAYLSALLNIAETLNRPVEESEALAYIHGELEKLFVTDVAFYTFNLMNTQLILQYPAKTDEFSELEEKAFDACHDEYLSTGTLTTRFPESRWCFEPMMSTQGFEGILAIKLRQSPLRHDKGILNIILSFADLSATIINRIASTNYNQETKIREEKEKLRTMLLSSVSHDLKTPLASIIGSLDVYHNLGTKLPDESKTALTQTAYQEALRLDSFITNILDMAKLESGSLKINPDWVNVEAMISNALKIAASKLGKRKIIHTQNNIYEVMVDENIMLRAFSHLFDNISKYTPDNSSVTINYNVGTEGFTISIRDEGNGISEDMLEKIFSKYTRIDQIDHKVAGTGLGLPLTRGIIELHDGSIVAFNNTDGKGAEFRISLPQFREAKKEAA